MEKDPNLVSLAKLALVVSSTYWTAGSPMQHKAVCMSSLPLGFRTSLVGNYSFCGVYCSFFSSINEVLSFFFFLLQEIAGELVGFCGAQKELWESGEGLSSDKRIILFSAVKQVAAS